MQLLQGKSLWPPHPLYCTIPGGFVGSAAIGRTIDVYERDLLMLCGGLQEWGSCRGSRETSRGYTCGLWLLLHSLAARSAPPETVGAFWMTAVK